MENIFVYIAMLSLIDEGHCQNSVINPTVNERYNTNNSKLYYEKIFKTILIYKHMILTQLLVALSCIDQQNNPYSNDTYLDDVKWYSNGEPIYKSVIIRSFVDRFGFIMLMTTKNSAFQILCTAKTVQMNHPSKNVTVLHMFTVYDSSVQMDTLNLDLFVAYTTRNNMKINSTMSEKDRKAQYKLFLDKKVRPCSLSFQKRIKSLAEISIKMVCENNKDVCDQGFINFYNCLYNDFDLVVNISLDMTYYYNYRKMNMLAPVLDYDIRIDGQRRIKRLCLNETSRLLAEIVYNEFRQYMDRIIHSNRIKYRSEIFCIGTASLLDPENNQTCILCGTGSFIAAFYAPVISSYKKTGLCKLCPKDQYSDIEGSYECTPCPPGSVTFFEGAYDFKHCHSQDSIHVKQLLQRYISEKGYFKFVFKYSETRRIMILGVIYFSPLAVIVILWVVHNSFVTGNNYLNGLYDMQLELGKIIIMMKFKENQLKHVVKQTRALSDEAYLMDSYEQ